MTKTDNSDLIHKTTITIAEQLNGFTIADAECILMLTSRLIKDGTKIDTSAKHFMDERNLVFFEQELLTFEVQK